MDYRKLVHGGGSRPVVMVSGRPMLISEHLHTDNDENDGDGTMVHHDACRFLRKRVWS